MTFSFRHRIELHEPQKLPVSEHELMLENTGNSRVVLVSRERESGISETTHLALRGSGFASEADAQKVGETWRSILQRVFAANRVGADFGDRSPMSGLTRAGRRVLEEKARDLGHEVQALADEPGLMVFPSKPNPVFVGMNASATVALSVDRLVAALDSPASRLPMTARESTAYDLFAASFRRGIGTEARLLLLMTALEMLMEQHPRDKGASDHVDDLIRLTREADISERDRESMTGSLRYLKNESFRQAGRRLAETLGDRKYLKMKPEKFFVSCYDLRSRVVHGDTPFPTREEVGRFGAALEVFVADLLAGPELLDQLDSTERTGSGAVEM